MAHDMNVVYKSSDFIDLSVLTNKMLECVEADDPKKKVRLEIYKNLWALL